MWIQRRIIPKTHEREIIKDFHFERVTTPSRSLSVIILFVVNKISLEGAQGSIMMEFQPFVLSRNVILLLLYLKGANASKEAST